MGDQLLVVDDLTRDLLGIENAICLYPSCGNEVPWSITTDEYHTLNKCLTLLIDDIADYLTDLPMLKIRTSREALRKLIRANAAQILYIIADRLIRVFKFIDYTEEPRISLIETRKFPPPSMCSDLLPLAKDSWEFSQYLVNEILADNERVEIPQKDILFPEECWDIRTWQTHHGFNYQPKSRSIIRKILTLMRSPFSIPVLEGKNLVHRGIHKMSTYGKSLPIYSLGYSERVMLTRGFFWPLGKFCKLRGSLPNIPNKDVFDSDLRNHLAEITKDHFAQKMHELVKEMGIRNIETNKRLGSISRLFFHLFPISMLEHFDIYYNWSIEQLKGFRIRHYISNSIAGSDIPIYYNSAATELEYKVWGIQMSAWGGYLANVPRIAEPNIGGADYYITSGWAHSEPHLPSWKIEAVPLSSPHYSEMKKRKRRSVKHRSVLLATGEMFNFPPVFYNGAFYPDNFKKWADIIGDLIQCFNERDIHVVLKNYDARVTEILNHYGVINKWLKVAGNNMSLSSSDAKGTARSIFGEVGATIWDIPSGGFVESILLGTPAFSLWNDDFSRCQPQAKLAMGRLIEVGILNANGADMARNVSKCIRRTDWWNEPKRKRAVDDFMSTFVKTNARWVSEWKEFLRNMD